MANKMSYDEFAKEVLTKLEAEELTTENGNSISFLVRELPRAWRTTPEGGFPEVSANKRIIIDAKSIGGEISADLQYSYCDYVTDQGTVDSAVERMHREIEQAMNTHIRIHNEIREAGIEAPEL